MGSPACVLAAQGLDGLWPPWVAAWRELPQVDKYLGGAEWEAFSGPSWTCPCGRARCRFTYPLGGQWLGGANYLMTTVLRHRLVEGAIWFYDIPHKVMVGGFRLGRSTAGWEQFHHGGITALIIDDQLPHVLIGLGVHEEWPTRNTFTKALSVAYRKPIPLGSTVACTTTVTSGGPVEGLGPDGKMRINFRCTVADRPVAGGAEGGGGRDAAQAVVYAVADIEVTALPRPPPRARL